MLRSAQVAANSGVVDPRTVDWARGQLFTGLRANVTVCESKFSSGAPPLGFDESRRFALDYLRYSEGDAFPSLVERMCVQARIR
jgi:hypothetical protein